MELITCVKCGESQETGNFYKSKNNKRGFVGVCKKCFYNKTKEPIEFLLHTYDGIRSRAGKHIRYKNRLCTFSRSEFVLHSIQHTDFLQLFEMWKKKYGDRAYFDIIDIFKKPYYVLIIQRKYKVCERTIKYWKLILK